MKPSDPTNRDRWNELARRGVLCSQPRLALTPDSARAWLNADGRFGPDLTGKKVLCLASGGGQQSIGFALLGADVTVVDFSEEQLARDRAAAEHYGKTVAVVRADMRDLSPFAANAFDVVYQPYSINYVPTVAEVFREVSRVLRPAGWYDLMLHNPYAHGTWKNGCWTDAWAADELWRGKGYPVWQPYRDGQPITTEDPHWSFTTGADGVRVPSPREYRHTFATVMNELIANDLQLVRVGEEAGGDYASAPGTWAHYTACLPPWWYLLCRKGK